MRFMNLIYSLVCVAIAGGILGACKNEFDEPNLYNGEKAPMTFTAGTPQSRTALDGDGKNVKWVKGDAIAIYDGTEANEFTTQDEGASATFTGTARQVESYTAFYPYANVTEVTATTITFNLPEEQTAVAGGFACGLVPSWAQTADGSTQLEFHNLCALVKFTVGEGMAGVGSYILRGTKGESLAGGMTYTVGGSGQAEVTAETSLNEIKLNGTFEVGNTYYFVVAPTVLNEGLSLFYVNSRGTAFRRGGAKAVTLNAGDVLDLGEQTSASFAETIINLELIEKIEASISSGGGKKMVSPEKLMKTSMSRGSAESGTVFEKNSDGTITLTPENISIMEGVTSVYIDNIKNVSGIEYFTNLTSVNCDRASEQEILDLTALKNLTYLYFACDKLVSLNLSGLDKLESVYVKSCPLTSLNLTNLPSLKTLSMGEFKLTSLDVTHLTSLEELDCFGGSLQTLNVSGLTNLTRLTCGTNQLESLNLRGLTKLTSLACENNQLTSLDLTDQKESLTSLTCSNNNLASFELSDLKNLNYLGCSNIGTTSLTLSGLQSLKYIYCERGSLTSLNISDMPVLSSLVCHNNQLTSLTLSNLPKLDILECNNNKLTSLMVNGLTALSTLKCNDNQLTSLDLNGLENLKVLHCENNQFTALNVNGLTKLKFLYCDNNKLTSLDLSGLTNLYRLDCVGNQLTALDFSSSTGLVTLMCGNNKLTSLDVSKLNELKHLHCNDNQLETLDTGSISRLVKVNCSNNKLTSLSVVNSYYYLTHVECHRNQLSLIDLFNLSKLEELKCGQQTNADGTPLIAILDIHSTMIESWNTDWSQYPENANVTLIE